MLTGLPVMSPGWWLPWLIVSYSSSIQIMCWGVVMTSGAGTSVNSPMLRAIWRTHPRQICSCSRMLRWCGSQTTPPLPPPRGMSTSAHFQVIHIARARTVSIVSCGWKRMPPLLGPRASLCCTRKPLKTCTSRRPCGRGRELVLALSVAQQRTRAGVEFEQVGDAVELPLRHLECVEASGCHRPLLTRTCRAAW
jgi:hypothetical protein